MTRAMADDGPDEGITATDGDTTVGSDGTSETTGADGALGNHAVPAPVPNHRLEAAEVAERTVASRMAFDRR